MSVAVALALGLLIGVVVGGLGGGGGVLTVPALVYVLGQSAQDATTSSLIIVGATAVVGAVVRARGGLVVWRTGLAFGAVGIPAAWLGSVLNRQVAEPVLLLAFAGLTLLAAAALLVNAHRPGTNPDDPDVEADAERPRGEERAPPTGGALGVMTRPRVELRGAVAVVAKIVVCGLLVGFLTGFLGVGGGFLVVPVLVIVLRVPMALAIGTSLLIITLNSAASLVSRAGAMEFDPGVVAPFALAAVAGTFAGKVISDRLSGAVLEKGFAGMLLAVGVLVSVQSGLALASG